MTTESLILFPTGRQTFLVSPGHGGQQTYDLDARDRWSVTRLAVYWPNITAPIHVQVIGSTNLWSNSISHPHLYPFRWR